MKNLLRRVALVTVFYIAAYLIMFPKTTVSAGSDAIRLCAQSVVPALFPFLICSGYFSASGVATVFSRYLSPVMRPLFNLPGSAAIALVLGLVSGYPVGAVCAVNLYEKGQCTKKEAENILSFCNNSGPVFVLSVVGATFLQNPHIGRILYISHCLSAVLVGILFSKLPSSDSSPQKFLPKATFENKKNTALSIGSVFDSAIFTMLKISGFVVFFTVFASTINLGELTPFIHSLIEITGGLKSLCATDINFHLKLSLISFFLAFSGVSVLLQVYSIIWEYGLSLKPYILGKVLQGVFSFILTYLLSSKLPLSKDVFLKGATETFLLAPFSTFKISLTLIFLGITILFALLFISAYFTRRRS